jgi:hypothetical protein
VVEAFLETGKAVDAPQLAERLGWSVSKVRRIIAANHGSVDGVSVRQEGRESLSKSYQGHVTGAHKVWVYRPNYGTLRTLILELRASLVLATTPVQNPE